MRRWSDCPMRRPWCLTPYRTTEVRLRHPRRIRKDPCMSNTQKGRGALVAGGLAAILASACCLGPLLLITLGFSGAWIGNLPILEPYRPIFIGAALVAMFFAWRRIYRPAQACKPGDVCAIARGR